ncbi:MAG: GyrI-like domain-containing protein [Bdellovibrionaceae bacterium]|nr:GyrI-like domain-containing protein [Pseudobdellovibrionaceae bacterium]
MKFFFVSLILVLSSLFTYLYFYLGFENEVKNLGVVEEEFYLLAKKHIGPYHKINEVITEVEMNSEQKRIPCPLTFGNYLDNPQIADENRLRSEGGCISSKDIYSQLEFENPNIYSKILPLKKYVKFSFSGSPAISPFKVYPAAEEWFNKTQYSRGSSVLEIYKVNGKTMTTYYYFPIDTH